MIPKVKQWRSPAVQGCASSVAQFVSTFHRVTFYEVTEQG